MDSLERILGSEKFKALKPLEKTRLHELISASPVYTFLIPGIMDEPNWRRVLGEAYLKYVASEKPARAPKPAKVEKPTKSKEVIFGVGATDSSNFTISRMM